MKLGPHGLSLHNKDQDVLYYNFGNIKFSSANVDFNTHIENKHLLKREDQNLIGEMKIEEVEIWKYTLEKTEEKSMDIKNLTSNICSEIMNQKTLDPFFLVPSGVTLEDLKTVLIEHECVKDENFALSWSKDPTLIAKSAEKNPEIENLASKGSNGHIDLYIPQGVGINLDNCTAINTDIILLDLKESEMPIVKLIDENGTSFEKLIRKLDEIVKKTSRDLDNPLLIYFFDIINFLQLPGFSTSLFQDPEFLPNLLSLVFFKETIDVYSSNKWLYFYHKTLHSTFDSLRRLLSNNKSLKVRKPFFTKGFLKICLDKLTFYYIGDERRTGRKILNGSKEKIIIDAFEQQMGAVNSKVNKKQALSPLELENKYYGELDSGFTKKICDAIFCSLRELFDFYSLELSDEDVSIVEESEIVDLTIKYLHLGHVGEFNKEHSQIYVHILGKNIIKWFSFI